MPCARMEHCYKSIIHEKILVAIGNRRKEYRQRCKETT